MAEDYMQLYQKALTGLQTGGKKLEASLAEIEEGKRQAIGRGQQALVSGGLSGTTMAAGVPLQAEKVAGRQRLGARGQAEETYLTTLASFAAFAQRGEEARKQRQFETQMTQSGQRFQAGQALTAYQRQAYQTRLGREYETEQAGMQREWETEERLQTEWSQRGTQTQAEQFPAIYDQGGTVPDWISGAGDVGATTPVTGAGGGAGGGYEIDFGGGYTPQTGDYMSVAGGPGGAIKTGGATTSFGGAAQSPTQKTEYRPEKDARGRSIMGVYINGRRVGSKRV